MYWVRMQKLFQGFGFGWVWVGEGLGWVLVLVSGLVFEALVFGVLAIVGF